MKYPINIFPMSKSGERWPFSYAVGTAKEILGSDLFHADQPLPAEDGTYAAMIGDRHAFIVVATIDGIRVARVATIDDTNAIEKMFTTVWQNRRKRKVA